MICFLVLIVLGAALSYAEALVLWSLPSIEWQIENDVRIEMPHDLWIAAGGSRSKFDGMVAHQESTWGYQKTSMAGFIGPFSGSAHIGPAEVITICEAGWPFYCLRGVRREWEWDEFVQVEGLWTPPEAILNVFERALGSDRMEWPVRPIVGGLLLNSMGHVVLMLGGLWLWQTTRRALRRRASRCEGCSHVLVSTQECCPECGRVRNLPA